MSCCSSFTFRALLGRVFLAVCIETTDKEDVPMQTAHELFVHELQDMLDAEQKLVEALGNQAEESSRPDLQKAFQAHQAQTEKQVERLHQVFESIGEDAEEVECKGIKGLIEEHDSFREEEDPAPDIM